MESDYAADVPEIITDELRGRRHEAAAQDKALREVAEWVIDRMERVIRAVDSGSSVNSLGELQQMAHDLDRLCVTRQLAHQEVTRAEYVVRLLEEKARG